MIPLQALPVSPFTLLIHASFAVTVENHQRLNHIIILLFVKEFSCRLILAFSFQIRIIISQVFYGGCLIDSNETPD